MLPVEVNLSVPFPQTRESVKLAGLHLASQPYFRAERLRLTKAHADRTSGGMFHVITELARVQKLDLNIVELGQCIVNQILQRLSDQGNVGLTNDARGSALRHGQQA